MRVIRVGPVLPKALPLRRLTRPPAGPGSAAHLAGLAVVIVVGLLAWLACDLGPAVAEAGRVFRLRWWGAPATAAVVDSWTTTHGAATRYHVRYEFSPGPGSDPVAGQDSLEPDQSARIEEAVGLRQVPVRYLPSDPAVNAVDDAIAGKDVRRCQTMLLFTAVLALLAFLLAVLARSVSAEWRARRRDRDGPRLQGG
jgi:hypothetical protein